LEILNKYISRKSLEMFFLQEMYLFKIFFSTPKKLGNEFAQKKSTCKKNIYPKYAF